jgi:hypothetical protein
MGDLGLRPPLMELSNPRVLLKHLQLTLKTWPSKCVVLVCLGHQAMEWVRCLFGWEATKPIPELLQGADFPTISENTFGEQQDNAIDFNVERQMKGVLNRRLPRHV